MIQQCPFLIYALGLTDKSAHSSISDIWVLCCFYSSIILSIYNKSLSMDQPKHNNEQEKTLFQLHAITRLRTPNYPYYPITQPYFSNGLMFLIGINVSPNQSFLSFHPLKDEQKLTEISIYFDKKIPTKFLTCLHILDFKWKLKEYKYKSSIVIENIEVMIGCWDGYLVRCKSDGRNFEVIEKFNKKINNDSGLMMRMSTMFFGSEQWYERSVKKPVFNFKSYQDLQLKYNYSYQIGKKLYFCTQLSAAMENEFLYTFQRLLWTALSKPSIKNHTGLKIVSILSKGLRAIVGSRQMLIQFEEQIPASYIYCQRGLFVSNNYEGKIILYSCENLSRIMVYKVDWQIKNIKLYKNILTVIPKDNCIYLVNLDKNQATALGSHLSYVANVIITPSQFLISGGCDHRVGLKYLKKIVYWKQIDKYCIKQDIGKMSELKKERQIEESSTLYYEIIGSKLVKQKMGETYFFGQFDNVNRNNNNEYGFGEVIHIHGEFYGFLTYDDVVKVYRIKS